MHLENFTLDDSFLVRTSGTSDGTQDKYFVGNRWFKLDRYGGEGMAEYCSSQILKFSGLPNECFVEYFPCFINGKPGCYSENFLKEEESFITLYRLYKNVTGKDLASVCSKMDYDDAIDYVLAFVKEQTGVDLKRYLANVFALDQLILNEDRHFNNLGIIFDDDTFREAPIFDNGKSFLIGNKRVNKADPLSKQVSAAFSKAFSPDFILNKNYLKNYSSLDIVKSDLLNQCKDFPEPFLQILAETITRN